MDIKIVLNVDGATASKMADAELLFTDGPLEGLRLVGFAVWERRTGERTVTFPARAYCVNGERRSFALLRPTARMDGSERLCAQILTAYAAAIREEVSHGAA